MAEANRWRFVRLWVEYVIVHHLALRAEDANMRAPAAAFLADLEEWRSKEPDRRSLREMIGMPRNAPLPSNETLGRMLEERFHAEKLVCLRRPKRRVVVPLPKGNELLAPDLGDDSPTTWFCVKVLDEVGDPVDGLDIRFEVAGATSKATTNGAGVARIENVTSTRGSAVIASQQALRDKMKPRWATPRDPTIEPGENSETQEIDDVEPVSLEAEVPFTIYVLPHFACNEVPGEHFEFGHSFPRSEAFEQLSEIAEELREHTDRKAMILAHTDKAGGEHLNKELSERRAKAVYALLTQDDAAWMALWKGKPQGKYWWETWGLLEAQHQLNALSVADDKGKPVLETGYPHPSYRQALTKFQAGDYPDAPASLGTIPDTKGKLDDATIKQLFLAYAMRVSRDPVDAARLGDINGSKFMGCGEYNPLTDHVTDDASRRCVIFTYDAAAEPSGLPCALGDIGPCTKNLDPPPKPDAKQEGKPHYRCRIYQAVAKKCPCTGGPALSHDLLIRYPRTLAEINALGDELTLQTDDGDAFKPVKKVVKDEARAGDDQIAELYFTDLPPRHRYRLGAKNGDGDYIVFDHTLFDDLSDLSDHAEYDPAEGELPADPDLGF